MSSGKQISIARYFVLDYITAALAWLCFYVARAGILRDTGAYPISFLSCLYILIIVPAGWLGLYALAGTYTSLYKKSRLAEFTLTFICTVFGSIILFFVFVLNDPHKGYSYYFITFLILLALHFSLTFTVRYFLLNKVKKQLLKLITAL